jgi:hypothetical protein
MPDLLPKNILYLKLGEKYNREIKKDILPKSLLILEFDKYSNYNKTIEKNILPQSLKKITFGCYNKKFKEFVLPQNLKTLVFPRNYNEIIKDKNFMPKSLKYLEIDVFSFIHIYDNIMKNNIEIIYTDKIYNYYPSSTKKLIIENYEERFERYFEQFPVSIKEVYLINYNFCNMQEKKNYGFNLFNKYGDKINI